MGCVGGVGGPFATAPPCQVKEIHAGTPWAEDLIGQQVQVMGRVAQGALILESPFTEKQGVAIKITCMTPSGGAGGGAKKTLFTASCCKSFEVVDGDLVVRVIVSAQSRWNLALQKTDMIYNIYGDENRKFIFSGGAKPGLKCDSIERPHALKFWTDFNGGKDPPSNMTVLNGKGMSGFGNRPREAKEAVLTNGDLVSIVGILSKDENGFFMDAGAMTNMEMYCKPLKACVASQKPGAPSTPQVCRMEKDDRTSSSSAV